MGYTFALTDADKECDHGTYIASNVATKDTPLKLMRENYIKQNADFYGRDLNQLEAETLVDLNNNEDVSLWNWLALLILALIIILCEGIIWYKYFIEKNTTD